MDTREEVQATLQDVEQIANDDSASPNTRRLANAVQLVLRQRAEQLDQAAAAPTGTQWPQQPAANGGDLATAPTESPNPPPLTSSIPPGLYEAPRGEGAQAAGSHVVSGYEQRRNEDGTIGG